MISWLAHLPIPLALSFVALIGYWIGRRRAISAGTDSNCSREFRRAHRIVSELEHISEQIRTNLATHHACIQEFRDRIQSISRKSDSAVWSELSDEAERMLRPTMRLSAEISRAYDEIRQQTTMLMSFTEVRTDALTGLSNRRAIDESLTNLFALRARYKSTFSIVIFDLDHFKSINDQHGHLYGDQVLQSAGRTIDEFARETDLVARFGGEEFVVIMPETDLSGACTFCERVRARFQETQLVTVSGGAAVANVDDTPDSLFARADAALYSAKSSGRNTVHIHDSRKIVSLSAYLAKNAQPTCDLQMHKPGL